jgi:hypothetical protein
MTSVPVAPVMTTEVLYGTVVSDQCGAACLSGDARHNSKYMMGGVTACSVLLRAILGSVLCPTLLFGNSDYW